MTARRTRTEEPVPLAVGIIPGNRGWIISTAAGLYQCPVRPGGWEATLFDDLLLETLDKRDHVALFGLGHLELRQGRGRMTEEHVPVALADAHALVDEHHVP